MTSLVEALLASRWFLPACVSVALLLVNTVLLYVLKDGKTSHKSAGGVAVDTDGGTKFVEDDHGHVVRRSSRVRKSVTDVDYATLNTGTPTRQRRAKEPSTPSAVANGTPAPEVEPGTPPASPKVSARRRIKA